MRRMFLPLVVAAIVGAILKSSLPDIKRYLKMREM